MGGDGTCIHKEQSMSNKKIASRRGCLLRDILRDELQEVISGRQRGHDCAWSVLHCMLSRTSALIGLRAPRTQASAK